MSAWRAPRLLAVNWPRYLFDSGHSSLNSAVTRITPATAAALAPAWSHAVTPREGFDASPSVYNSSIHIGVFYQLKETTGAVVHSVTWRKPVPGPYGSGVDAATVVFDPSRGVLRTYARCLIDKRVEDGFDVGMWFRTDLVCPWPVACRKFDALMETSEMANSLGLSTFYALKPLIPRSAQVAARRLRARSIWRALKQNPLPPLADKPFGYRWPDDASACAIVTHDVEQTPGQQNIPALIRIEEEFGVRSCWNFVVRRYPVDTELIALLREAGHEIGVHGVYHDGREYSSPEEFHRRLAVIESAAQEWGAVGFRSPSLMYVRSLLETVPFAWDSSMPAWDPFQPKRGDCLAYVPFKLNDHCVELPVTLWQDFTLFEELSLEDIDIWRKQIDFIWRLGGLINVIVHPDYMRGEQRMRLYRGLLEHLRGMDRLWIAKPSEVAAWARGNHC